MNLNNFLNNNFKSYNGFFSLISLNNKEEVIWFQKDKKESDYAILMAICKAYKVMKVHDSEALFCKEFISNNLILPNETNKQDYIDKHVKPLIKGGWLYDIKLEFKKLSIPKEVDEIKIISKEECLALLLKDK